MIGDFPGSIFVGAGVELRAFLSFLVASSSVALCKLVNFAGRRLVALPTREDVVPRLGLGREKVVGPSAPTRELGAVEFVTARELESLRAVTLAAGEGAGSVSSTSIAFVAKEPGFART